MNPSERRRYQSLGELLTDLRIIMRRQKDIRPLMQGEAISPAFRERLMLAVTAVNRCRYCSYYHAREALAKGVPQEEIVTIGEGLFVGSPPEEVPALLYAQHWAEANGEPEPAARDRVVACYGGDVVRMMELALRMIRVGNLTGNTFDYLLHRISFGRWGAWRNTGAPKTIFRSATTADAEAVSNVYLASRKHFLPYAPLAHGDDDVREWIARQLIPNSDVTVALEDGEVVGMIALDREGEIGWIDHLYLRPGSVGQGLGAQFVEQAKEKLGSPIRLYTFQANEGARRFYERHGFRAIEFSDGSANEEKCPDALYEWRQ